MKRGFTARLTIVAQAIIVAWGIRRGLIAVLAGAVSTLALSPTHAWPILFVTFPILVWLVDGSGGKRGSSLASAAAVGWGFGFGYFLAGLYWTGFAFLVDAQTFGWLLPFAVVALPAGLALFTAFGFALARLFWTRGPMRILALAAALTVSEWLRGNVLGGFPWNAFGYALTGPLSMAQSASLIGLWGLTFVAVLVFASPAALADDKTEWPRALLLPVIACAGLVALAGFGSIRLMTTQISYHVDVRLRVMQPNLPQDLKFNYGARHQIMERYLALSQRGSGARNDGLAEVTHLIWPESAFPFYLAREPEALAQIANLLPSGTVLITGAARPAAAQRPNETALRAHNAIYVIDHDGSIAAVYDKMHLVPFGEFLPFQDVLERLGLMQLTKVKGGFVPGDRRRPMLAGRAPAFAPLICYEAIFPGHVVTRSERPGWLLNVTNDAWFGKSSGPHQHLQQARLRAIEEGLPLVRAANTGISAVVDPLGRVLARLPLGAEGTIDSALPRALPPTVYARFGDAPAAILVVLSFAAAIRSRRRNA